MYPQKLLFPALSTFLLPEFTFRSRVGILPLILCLSLLTSSALPAQKRRAVRNVAAHTAPSVSATQDPNVLAAESYFKNRNFAKAIEALELVVAANPKRGEEVYLMLAQSYWQTGQQSRALSVCV